MSRGAWCALRAGRFCVLFHSCVPAAVPLPPACVSIRLSVRPSTHTYTHTLIHVCVLCTCLCVCVSVCVFVCVPVSTPALRMPRSKATPPINPSLYMCACVHLCACACARMYVCVRILMRICMCICTYVCVCEQRWLRPAVRPSAHCLLFPPASPMRACTPRIVPLLLSHPSTLPPSPSQPPLRAHHHIRADSSLRSLTRP